MPNALPASPSIDHTGTAPLAVRMNEREPRADSFTVLGLAPNHWEAQWMNRQQILSRLARRHTVLYSTGPWSVWEVRDADYRRAPLLGRFELRDGVWVDQAPRWLLSWPSRRAWDATVDALTVRRWRNHLDRIVGGPLVCYVFHPRYRRLADRVGADLLVYNPFDLFSRTSGWTAQDQADEVHLLRNSGLVIASSEPARVALQARADRPVLLVPNGVDADLFERGSAQSPPADLAAIPHPRIGYVGSVNSKVDATLVAALARREPGWNFVFIGPVFGLDERTQTGIAACRRLANVHFLAARPMKELPAAMGGLDVGLMCYRKDTWADFGYPLKLHEYLACGLPVVSTPLQSLLGEQEWITVAEGEDGWHAAIAAALAGHGRGSRDERRAVARRNTWDIRTATIEQAVGAALRQHVGHPAERIAD